MAAVWDRQFVFLKWGALGDLMKYMKGNAGGQGVKPLYTGWLLLEIIEVFSIYRTQTKC